jgi:arylamine N-acetyltransferase
VNIVTLPDGSQYMCDVAFGGDGPTLPLPLTYTSEPPIFTNLGTQQIRLIHSTIPPELWDTAHPAASLSPQYTDSILTSNPKKELKYHIYEYRNSPTQPWNAFFCFPEYEFYPPDFRIMNWWTSTSPHASNFQTSTVLVVRFLMAEESQESSGDKLDRPKIVGKIMLVNDKVKQNDGGKTRVVFECKSEAERIGALKKYYDIELTEEEIVGIKGRSAELLSVD